MEAGVLTEGEAAYLQTDKFLRAELVYISYYALEARLPDSTQTLANLLQDKGVFTAKVWKEARKSVSGTRL